MRPAIVVAALLFLALPAAGQDAAVSTTAQSLTFDNPSGAGLRSYTMVSSSLTVAYPVRRWLSAGTGVHIARASMVGRGGSEVEVSGLSSAEIFAAIQRGRLEVRAAYAPAIGQTSLSSGSLVVASLAGAEVLPFPVRGWGSGSGYAVDATVLVAAGVEFFGSVRGHGLFTPLDNDPMEFRLGNEVRIGTRLSMRPSALSHAEVGMLLSHYGSDRDAHQELFSPGTRFRLHAAGVFPVARTTILLRGDIYRRTAGSVFDPPPAAAEVPVSLLGGGTDTQPRTLASLYLESRASAGTVPLLVTVAGRIGDGASDNWLVWGGVGAEIEVRPPMPGRWHLVPMGRIYHGATSPARDFESGMVGWEFSMALRWDGR